MKKLHLKIITPKKLVKEEDIDSLTAPTSNGEITILPLHINLFSLMTEGIVKIKKSDNEEFLAVGGGYLQTDGKNLTILVSRAYGQSEIDEKLINKAVEDAKNILKTSHDEAQKNEAVSLMRKAMIDSRLLKKRKHRPV